MSGKVPVLLIGYYRPQLVKQVMEAIGRYKPAKFYVACDGPRAGDEKCVSEVRERLEEPHWDTEVFRLFLDKNMGPGQAINNAIDWFFSHEPEGIVLEEDCIPNLGFFELAEHVLTKYRDDSVVWGMTGSNTAGLQFESSYGFVQQPLIWGWASWADRWEKHDKDYKSFFELEKDRNAWPSTAHRLAVARHLKSMARHGFPDTWDYPFAWTVMSHRGLWVVPTKHLIDNAGVGQTALNSKSRRFRRQPLQDLGPIVEPESVDPDHEAEKKVLRHIHGLVSPVWLNYPLNALKIFKVWFERQIFAKK